MSKDAKKPKREPLHLESSKNLNPDAFAESVADKVLAEVNAQRKRAGKPPLK